MPKFRADFDVKSSIVLPKGSAPLTFWWDDPQFEITIRNAPLNQAGHVPSLSVAVVGEATAIEEVAGSFRDFLAGQLDFLSFVTQSSFLIEQCRRVVDWEPHQRTRKARILQKFDPLDPPKPVLAPECVRSAWDFSRQTPAGYVTRALRCFRYGLLTSHWEEQFQHFWLALETIAEGSKDPTKVPIDCPRCHTPVHCSKCNETPMRTPMARQAIRELCVSIVDEHGDEAYHTLVGVRDGLLHGRSPDRIVASVRHSIEEIVDTVGSIAWSAILRKLPHLDQQPTFYGTDQPLVRGELVAAMLATFEHRGEDAHPAEDQIVTANIELNVRFDGDAPAGG